MHFGVRQSQFCLHRRRPEAGQEADVVSYDTDGEVSRGGLQA